MNREIKFKAVTKEGNVIDVASIQFMEDGSCIVNDEFPIDGSKLIQFTGLKDKNGKEIYEGDVLRYDYLHPTLGKQTFINKVAFYDGNGRWGAEIGDMEYHFFGEIIFRGVCEIIGNIYSNPELLK